MSHRKPIHELAPGCSLATQLEEGSEEEEGSWHEGKLAGDQLFSAPSTYLAGPLCKPSAPERPRRPASKPTLEPVSEAREGRTCVSCNPRRELGWGAGSRVNPEEV